MSCEEPYETGLFVKNTSSETHTFQINPVMVEVTTRELAPGKEWHYTSSWYGKHYIKILTANNVQVIVDVPNYDEKNAVYVEWDGSKFWSYTSNKPKKVEVLPERPKEIGLFVRNSTTENCTFRIKVGTIDSTKELLPDTEWNFTSMYYGDHWVAVISPTYKATTVYVYEGRLNIASRIEWNGTDFKSYQKK